MRYFLLLLFIPTIIYSQKVVKYGRVFSYALDTVEPYHNVEEFGIIGDGKYFYNTLDITPISDTTSIVFYKGINSNTFNEDWVGKLFSSFRISKSPNETPTTRGYFPGVICSRYSTVTDVIDGRTLIVDLRYSPSLDSNISSISTSGYFFTDNRDNWEAMLNDTSRHEKIMLQDDKVYVIKGVWNSRPIKGFHFVRSNTGKTKPVIKLSLEDAFSVGFKGDGSANNVFISEFGDKNLGFIRLPDNNEDFIFEDIDIVGSTFYQPCFADCDVYGNFFVDNKKPSNNSGRYAIINSNIFEERERYLNNGVDTSGCSWALPTLVYCLDGGSLNEDSTDIDEYARYELINTSWQSVNIAVTAKAQYKSGVIFKMESDSDVQILHEMEQLKPTSYDSINTKFSINELGFTEVEISSDYFNFYLLSNQDWLGGTGVNYNTYNTIEVYGEDHLYFSNNADWWELGFLDNISPVAKIGNTKATMFDKIAERGDTIKYVGNDPTSRGVIYASNDTIFIWGYAVKTGDTLSYGGDDYVITSCIRTFSLPGVFGLYAKHYYIVVLSSSIVGGPPSFTVKYSGLEYLLDGTERMAKHFADRDKYGHLFYVNSRLNMILKNVETKGYWRSTDEFTELPGNSNNVRFAEFENVFVRGDGGIGREWKPIGLNIRHNNVSDTFGIKINGGNTQVYGFSNQSGSDRIPIFFTNAPVLRSSLHGKFSIDSGGFSKYPDVQGEDPAITISLYDGDSISLKNSNGRRIGIFVHGSVKINIDGVYGYIGENGRMHGISFYGDSTSVVQVSGTGGGIPMRFVGDDNIFNNTSKVKVHLTNWIENREYYTNKIISLPFSDLDDPNFCDNIIILDQSLSSLVPECN